MFKINSFILTLCQKNAFWSMFRQIVIKLVSDMSCFDEDRGVEWHFHMDLFYND